MFSKLAKSFVEFFVTTSDMKPVGKDLFWQIFIATISTTPRKFWLPIASSTLSHLINHLTHEQKKDLGTDIQSLVVFDWKHGHLSHDFSRAVSNMNNELHGHIWHSVIYGYVWMISWWATFSKRDLIKHLAPLMLSQAKLHLQNYEQVQKELHFIAHYDYHTKRDAKWKQAYCHIKNELHCSKCRDKKAA